MEQSRSEHILALAKELLDDIELSRLPAESLLLKASRLARWVGSDEIKYWINLEMQGYNSTNEISLKYMGLTGRWTNIDEMKGYWGPLAQQEAALAAQNIKLKSLTTPDTSGDWALRVMDMYQKQLGNTTSYISTLSGIKSRVLSILHNFVSAIYYEKEFDNLSESIFEKYKSDVDSLISANCGDVLEQIPSVMSRLAEGNAESISQALTTVRRIIDSFADSIYPARETTINIGGNEITLGANKHQNRINAFVHERIESKSRKVKIRQNLANLYDRVSTGVHNDVSAEEARSLFLNCYLLLGEILHIADWKK
ncbi:TPA: hypothetical protein L4T01_000581 [Pseudomonas aeruginosa]|uniref:AbiTii domain-containing protein n=1 Tax=Pseudomonas TaxID=286 RepID=UPI001CBD61A8|nr:hypothetical protein [Pseudomonas aeruginosa]HBO3842485.1 hypothetical protein [Pseudomonas aeruginosa]HCF6814708.1 hypothetical protein [Pseudomonas aeruginosa]HDQ4450719.1 hypothetical protein [Pseudomonas aeruginosa]